MLRKAKQRQQTILLLNEDDFVSKHNSELLGYLEDVPKFKNPFQDKTMKLICFTKPIYNGNKNK